VAAAFQRITNHHDAHRNHAKQRESVKAHCRTRPASDRTSPNVPLTLLRQCAVADATAGAAFLCLKGRGGLAVRVMPSDHKMIYSAAVWGK
jgi:hypothetical protein